MGLRSALARLLGRPGAAGARRRGGSWWGHPQAPRFHVAPGIDQLPGGQTFRLLMTFRQLQGPDVEANLTARWRGSGIVDDFATPMLDIRERTYQMRPSIADADAVSDEEIPPQHVGFELRFHWREKERHCLWIWPLEQQRDGRWALHTTSANTDAPASDW